MAKLGSNRAFGLLILMAWVSSLYFLIPLPNQRIDAFAVADKATTEAFIEREMKVTGLGRPEVERLITLKHDRDKGVVWVRWVFTALLVIAGLTAGVMALRSANNWPYFAMVTSLLYLVAWGMLLTGLRAESHSTILDTYVSNLLNSLSTGSAAAVLAFFHRDLVLPLLHFFVFTFLLYKGSRVTTTVDAT